MGGPEENGDGHVDGFDESEEIYEGERVVIRDEEGQDIECVVVLVIEHEGDEYALLRRITESESEDEDEVVEYYPFRRVIDEEGHEGFESIEDDELFESVRREFALLVETDDGEEE